MDLEVNGQDQTITKEIITVADLLTLNNVESPDTVSVQVNGKFVARADYDTTRLTNKDQVDFLYFLGGGYFQ